MVGTEPAAPVQLTPGAEPVYRALTVDQFGVFLRRWHEEAGGGTVSRAALTQALETLAARALGDAQAALPATPPQAPEPTAEEQADEARSEAAVAALRALVPRLRPAADNELVVAFLERRGLDPALITDLDLAGALPHVDVAAEFAEFALGGAEDGVSGNWWATRHLLMVPFRDVDTDEVVSARARYCGLGVVDAAKKALAPSGCPVRGSWARCPRWGAYVRGEMPPPKTLIVCEGEVDWLTVVLAIHRRGLSIGVVGIVSGCWTDRSAAKIPPGTRVVLLTHSDRAGCGYRDTIARSLGKRDNLFVRHIFSSEDKLPDENDLSRDLGDKYDPLSCLHAWSAPPAVWPLTDAGNAERLVHRHGGDLRHCVETGVWYAWAGTRWLHGAEARAGALNLALETVRLSSQVESPATPEERDALAGWAQISEGLTLRERTVGSAALLPAIRVSTSDLDANPDLLGVGNGVLDLPVGRLVADPRAHLVTRHVAASYDPEARCPVWERVLLEIFQGDEEIVRFFQRAVGYSLSGRKTKKLVFVCHGEGGDNGKSLLLSTLAKLFGRYGGAFRPDLIADHGPGHRSFHTAGLEGLRFATISELKPTARLSVDEVKRLAGGSDSVSADKKGKDDRTFPITWALWIALNRVPPLPSDDVPLLRRLLFLPFLRTFSEEEKDEDLPQKLEAEFPGILAWAIRGYQAYLARGIDAPAPVKAHTLAVRSDADSAGRFVAEECIRGVGLQTHSADLYAAYEAWAVASGMRPITETAFGLRLKDLGIGKARDRAGRTIRTEIALAPASAPAVPSNLPSVDLLFSLNS